MTNKYRHWGFTRASITATPPWSYSIHTNQVTSDLRAWIKPAEQEAFD